MPELPEVETVRKGLEKRLKGFLISQVQVITERSISSEGGSIAFCKNMQGSLVGGWTRRGKYLICRLKGTRQEKQIGWWVIHLRMTGQFQWCDNNDKACPHTRVRIWNKSNSEIRFVDTRNFGQMWWVSASYLPEEKINGLRRLGPEPFSKEFNPEYLQHSLQKRKRSIKASLLDQSVIAGVGNIYADESLFDAKILPTKESQELTPKEIAKLCKSLIKILKLSIGKGGTTFRDFRDLEGLNGNYGGQASVYKRERKPCKECGSIILKAKVAGRGTHWCPNCQK